MFDIGWSEMAIILLVALIVIGPRDLPKVARTMGRWVAKGRAMAREFQTALEDMARETELDTVKKEIEKAARTDFGKTIEKTIDPTGELGSAFDPNASKGSKAKPATTAKKAIEGPSPSPAASAPSAQPTPAAPRAEPAPNGSGTVAEGRGTVETPVEGSGAPVEERAKVPAEPR
jgi:sec-independent protein translocase protein TatB